MDDILYVGIDPGKDGAIVCLSARGEITKYVMPSIKKEYDPLGVAKIFRSFDSNTTVVCIEQVHAIYGVAAKATFTFGGVFYAMIQAAADFQLTFTLVPPKQWQKEMYQGIVEVRKSDVVIKVGEDVGKKKRGKRDTKVMSLMAAQRLFPTVDLRASARCIIPHPGIVDALLIAEYCRRYYRKV
jgi:hypothetical protein